MEKRTDLALEAKEIWEESAEETTRLPGVRARESLGGGVRTTLVEVLDRRGAEALGKPEGTYLTLELRAFHRGERSGFRRTAELLARRLRELMELKPSESVLVAGLGNRSVSPDALGPRVLDRLLVTRHLVSGTSGILRGCRSVAAISPGVLGGTGLESAELIRAAAERIRPDRLLAVDALASRSLSRVCTTIQLTDTGITPGSGVGNERSALTKEALGIPVTAVGVPTVVGLGTLMEDAGGMTENELNTLCGGQRMVVTPRDIDARVSRIARLLARGINLALQPELDAEDLACFSE